MKRPIALFVLGVLGFVAVGLTAGCSGGQSATAATVRVEGKAEVADVRHPWHPVEGSSSLGIGDQVRVIDGFAVVSLSGGRQLELRPGAQVTLRLGPGTADLQPELVAGDLLVVAPNGSVRVTTADTDARVKTGAARVSRGLSVLIGSYTAAVDVESAGQRRSLTPLRQVAVPAAGLLPPRPSPIGYAAEDAWDQRYLAEAAQLGEQLGARSHGFTAQLRQGEGQDPNFFRQLLPALAQEPAFGPAVLTPARPPGESLVALAITLDSTKGSFADRWQSVTAFHDEGADWGLVALDQGVARAALLNDVDAAIGRGPALVAQAPPPAPSPVAATSSGASRAAASASRSRAATPTPAQAGQAASAQTPTTSNAGPLNTGIPLVDSTGNSLVNLLSGLLSGVGR
jgi:hypothetical protein